jgi:two-component system CheB/CheR fusion protein
VQIPIVMVDSGLAVRRVTPAASQVFNVREQDIGRRLSELKPSIDIPDLEELLKNVIETLSPREKTVRDKQGKRFQLRIRPYRTADNKIDGAVLTLLDLSEKSANNRNKKS